MLFFLKLSRQTLLTMVNILFYMDDLSCVFILLSTL